MSLQRKCSDLVANRFPSSSLFALLLPSILSVGGKILKYFIQYLSQVREMLLSEYID